MSIDREESLFLTVSEDHTQREYPEYIRLMSEPFRRAGANIPQKGMPYDPPPFSFPYL